MHTSALKSILAITACALGAVAAADASAQTAATEPPAPQGASQQADTQPAQQTVATETAAGQPKAQDALPQTATGQTDGQQAAPEENAQAVPHAKILGAVNIQGNLYRQRELLPGENTEWIGSLADCLSQADGWLQNADISRVHILRANAEENTPPTVVNFRRYLEQGNSTFNPPVYVNDTIYIPETGNSGTVSVQTIRQIETRYYSTHYPYGYYYPQGPSVYIIQTPPPPRRPHKPGHPNTPPQQPPRPRPRPPRPQPPQAQPPAPAPQPAEPEGLQVVPAGTRASSRQQTRRQAPGRQTAIEQTIRVTPSSTGQQAQPQSTQQRGTITPVRNGR